MGCGRALVLFGFGYDLPGKDQDEHEAGSKHRSSYGRGAQAMIVKWKFVNGRNTSHNTWQGRSVFRASERLARYWDIELVQDVPPALIFQTRSNGAKGSAMAHDGNRIWVNADFRWGKSPAAIEQMTLCTLHEIGHWLAKGGGHAPAGNVMATVVGDPYVNWTRADMAWFGELPWKSTRRPWHEPRFWYPPAKAVGAPLDEYPLITLSC